MNSTKVFGATKEERDRVREFLNIENEEDQGDEEAAKLEMETDTTSLKIDLNSLDQWSRFINYFKR